MNRYRSAISIMALVLVPLLFSCLPGKRIESIRHEPEAVRPRILPSDITGEIDRRISILEDILKNEPSEDKRKISMGLLDDFRTIKASIRTDLTDQDYQRVIRVLFRGIGRFDDAYLLKIVPEKDKKEYSQAIIDYHSKRKRILDSYISSDFNGVIAQCLELEATFGPDSLTPDIGLVFATSLAKNNMVEEALNIGVRIARDLEGRPDLIHLRAEMVEWQLDMGNDEKAMQLFEKLVDNMDEREAILERTRLAVNRGADNETEYGSIQGIERDGPEFREPDNRDPIGDLLREVDRLVRDGKFTEARLLLIRHRLRLEEGPEIETIDQALESLDLAEARHGKSPSPEEEGMKSAGRLIEEENYEEAIKRLESIDGHDKDPEVKRIRDLAVERIINRERDRAAQIFLMAKKSDDLQKREELLLSSRKILEELIEKYPKSSLIDKLNDNLNKVKEELDKIQ